MTSADRPLLDGLLARSPAQRLARRRAAGRLPVLAYHGVDDLPRFTAQMDWLARETQPITLPVAVDALLGTVPLPPRAVLVTFDDGDRSVLEDGLSLLQDRGIPAVLFVVAGLIDTDEPFWWTEVEALVGEGGRAMVQALKQRSDDERRTAIAELRQGRAPVRQQQLTAAELRELEASGISVGNHTFSHPILARCDPDRIEGELQRSHQVLTDVLGHPPISFAYPNGDHHDLVPPLLAALGYRVAFDFDHRLAAVPAGDPFRISRLRVNASTTLDRFQTIVSGLHPALHHLRGRP